MNYSIPTFLSDFSINEDGRSTANLWVLYVGETADGRIFDDAFADQLADTLDDAPIVAFYSDLKKDFLGHNQTQYAFGHVPAGKHEFVEKEGQKWLKTSVVLYTDRIDNIGEIAKKIVGQPQSLELDPKTVTYEFETGADGKRKIRFKKGRICGLSVLGTEQKPAFTGAGFFSLNNAPVFESSAMKEKFETFFSCLEEVSRGGQVNVKLEQFESLANAAKLSYSERAHLVAKAVQDSMGSEFACYLESCYDNEVIVSYYNYGTDSCGFKKCKYSIGDDTVVTLGDCEEVFQVFVTQAEQNLLSGQTDNNASCEPNDDEDIDKDDDVEDGKKKEGCSAAIVSENAINASTDDFVNTNVTEGEPNESKTTSCEPLSNGEAESVNSQETTFETLKNQLETEFKLKEQQLVDQLAQSQSEKEAINAQLEDAKKHLLEYEVKERKDLIDSYKEDLSPEIIASFMTQVNDIDYKELESQLALSFRKASKGNASKQPLDFSRMGNSAAPQSYDSSNYADVVRKWVNK